MKTTKTKEQLELILSKWGAKKDKKVEDVYWLNGHCFIIKKEKDGYTLDEL